MPPFDRVMFSERQRFRQWWLWSLILIAPGISVWAVIQQVVIGFPFGDNPVPDYLLMTLLIVVGGGLPLFMYTAGLDTEVGDSGLSVRFRPFHFRPLHFYFCSIATAERQTYSPLKDYGGWGIRYGGNGKAYNVSGNKGVLLQFKDGRTLLIGSQRDEELSLAINSRLR